MAISDNTERAGDTGKCCVVTGRDYTKGHKRMLFSYLPCPLADYDMGYSYFLAHLSV